MMVLRPAAARGQFSLDWLTSYHSFSFGEYYDPAHMGFRALRVINDDRIAPGGGFPLHGHRDMEIITVVLQGAVAHRDSMGNEALIRPGEVQRMSAGTGVRHSEFNPSATDTLHLLQIWLHPERQGLPPSYEQKNFAHSATPGVHVLVSPDRADGSLGINQDARLSRVVLAAGEARPVSVSPARHVWLQVIAGPLTVNGQRLDAGDGLALSQTSALHLQADGSADLLLFDLA